MDLSIKIAILAMAAQIVLTMMTFIRMGKARQVSLLKGDLHIRDIALSNDAWADDIKKLGNNLQNQFETPIIFYAGVVLMAALSLNNWVITTTAVVYVALRVMHHSVHTGKNHVPTRYKIFVLSLLALTIMWVAIVIDVVML